MGQGFSTHLKVDEVVRAMAVGDLNQDGSLQVVTATDAKLMIHRFDGTRLALDKTLEYASHLRIVSLDIADINGNGYPEIFVSSTTVHRNNLASFVVEYDGSRYKTLVEDESRYFRVVTLQNNIQVLLAQDKGADPFSGRIYEMMPANDAYEEGKRLRLPRGTSVLSLARGPVSSQDERQYLSINTHNRLVLINDTGSAEWESTEKYGKTNNYWFLDTQVADQSNRERAYYNPRILFHPVGEDDAVKAFIVKNTEVGGGVLGRIKRFKEGNLQILGWNGIALATEFQTAMLQGWISDFALADIDGDGSDELLISVVDRPRLALLSRDTASNIISFELN